MIEDASETLLLGPLSLDVFLPDGPTLPGGGALNMAWHWQTLGVPFELLTRIGDGDPEPFLAFLDRHGIRYAREAIVVRGRSAAIDIEINADREPHMDNFVEGVWATYRLSAVEEALLPQASQLHVILVEGAIAELGRLHAAGILEGLDVSADFLGFRHYDVDRLAGTMAAVDLGFVGWPGALDDPIVSGMRGVAHDLGRVLVVTLGSRGVRVFDGRAGGTDRWFDVTPVPVMGTTVGCGDAFVAYFLAAWWRTGDLATAVAHGNVGGARATGWLRPLPPDAYEDVRSVTG